MASVQQPASSGSGCDGGDPRYAAMDERKRKRMMSNRESARRSRMRKQKQLDGLTTQVTELQNDNSEVERRINVTTQKYLEISSANKVLRAQVMELIERLRSLNSVLRVVEECSGVDLDIPEIPDPLLKPWQLPCSVQPVIASADMSQG